MVSERRAEARTQLREIGVRVLGGGERERADEARTVRSAARACENTNEGRGVGSGVADAVAIVTTEGEEGPWMQEKESRLTGNRGEG